MAIEDFPTRTIDSLGEVKSNKNAVTVPTKQYSAPEYEVLATRLIQLFTEVGKTDGSTAGSLREGLKRLQALRVANVATEGDLWNVSGSLNTDADLEEGALCYVDGTAAFICTDPTLGSATWKRLGPLSGAAVSVLGRSANSSGVVADIAASANDRLLARVSDAISFVQLSLGMVPDSLLTKAKLENSAAVSVLGRSANSSGVVADIAAGSTTGPLRSNGTSLGFRKDNHNGLAPPTASDDNTLGYEVGSVWVDNSPDSCVYVCVSSATGAAIWSPTLGNYTVQSGNIATGAVTKVKIESSAAVSVLGRSANSSGVVADIAASADDRLLARTSSALSFTQLTVGMVGSNILTWAKMAAEVGTFLNPSAIINTAKTSDYTMTSADLFVPVSTASGVVTITLPTASPGRFAIIKKTTTDANAINLDPGSANIDGTSGVQEMIYSTLGFYPCNVYVAQSATTWRLL